FPMERRHLVRPRASASRSESARRRHRELRLSPASAAFVFAAWRKWNRDARYDDRHARRRRIRERARCENRAQARHRTLRRTFGRSKARHGARNAGSRARGLRLALRRAEIARAHAVHADEQQAAPELTEDTQMEIVIVESVRSAVGRAHKGSLALKRPDELAG